MSFINYVFGPKLYMEYGLTRRMYEPGGLEKWGDKIISMLSIMWNIGYYTSPLIVTFLYRRGYLVAHSISSLAKFTTSIGMIVMISLCMRGIGRSQSRSYTKMVKALDQVKSPKTTEESRRALRMFDMEFSAWPVDFDVKNLEEDSKKSTAISKRNARPFRLATLPCEIAAYVAIHTFGIRLIYPGSVKILQSLMRSVLITGRSQLVEQNNGTRYKIRTADRNDIDSMFVDNRGKHTNGNTLVICSEGNAGFYEIGIMSTPIALKYSVLGWNLPGFEGSTGKPYPDQVKNAIDAVVKFAIYYLGFAVENIIFYGWSIGGYSTLVAASNYPDAKGVILDATFDDILYLAMSRMPSSLSGIVKIAIRDYCNLNLAELLPNYNGPISIIRRTEDEIIAEDNRIETNRGNCLVIALLKYRYPNIFQARQLSHIANLLSKPIENDHRDSDLPNQWFLIRLATCEYEEGKRFPMQIGENYTEEMRTKMAEYLLRRHFRDYKSTHCTPLPTDFFNIPWAAPESKSSKLGD